MVSMGQDRFNLAINISSETNFSNLLPFIAPTTSTSSATHP